jgi:hypothetical protein
MVMMLVVHLITTATAADRCVLAEEFSEKTCIECPVAEAALDSLLKYDFGPDQLAVISSLIDLFTPGINPEGHSRWQYYPPSNHPQWGLGYWTPVTWFDGVDEQTSIPSGIDSLWTIYRDKVQARLAVPSPLTMDLTVEYGAKADTGTVHVRLVATDVITFQDLHLRMAVIESGVNIGPRTVNHLMRDLFPDTLGVPLVISQGDTVIHSEPFVIKTFWADERCHIVAFVQDDTTREVLQSAQVPVVAPIPAAVSDLRVHLSGDDLLLMWSSVTQDTSGNPLQVSHYHIYRDTLAFRDPGCDPFQTSVDTFFVDGTGVVGDPEKHFFYWVTAMSGEKESADSEGVGEIDRHMSNGK